MNLKGKRENVSKVLDLLYYRPKVFYRASACISSYFVPFFSTE